MYGRMEAAIARARHDPRELYSGVSIRDGLWTMAPAPEERA
jgi:hypothetical protein